MLTIDMITPSMVTSTYDFVVTSRGLRKLDLPWDQWRPIAYRLRAAAPHGTVQVAIVMQQPSADLLPLALLEAADNVRWWDQERRGWAYAKHRDGPAFVPVAPDPEKDHDETVRV